MAIEIDGKVYRNLQQQVQKNMDDIQEIKEAMPYPSEEYYNKTESDEKFEAKSDLATVAETGDYDDLLNTPDLTIYSRKLYKHDILLSLADADNHYAGAHIVIIDEYAQAYDFAKVRADWRGNIYPVIYSRKQGSDDFTNLGYSKVYIYFYLDNDDEIWFEENETFYSGSAVVTESVYSYKVLAVDDTVELL